MDCLLDSLARYIGRTVTIFTTSGGLSGAGFTGVLVSVTPTNVKLITAIGAPPSCPVGSACTGPIGDCGGFGYGGYAYGGYGYSGYGMGNGCGCDRGFNWLGSVTEIPVESIASFTHNAI